MPGPQPYASPVPAWIREWVAQMALAGLSPVAELAASTRAPYDVFAMTLAYSGCRFGEVAALRWRFVDLDLARITVAASLSDADGKLSYQEPKSHQHRLVTIPSFLVALLRDMAVDAAGPDDLVFTSPDGMPLRHQNFMRRTWEPACARAGLTGVTPHDLRASHASWLYDEGWSPVEIAARLGHSKATVTTKHYARRMVGRDVQIAMGLDKLYAGESTHDVARGMHAVDTGTEQAREEASESGL